MKLENVNSVVRWREEEKTYVGSRKWRKMMNNVRGGKKRLIMSGH